MKGGAAGGSGHEALLELVAPHEALRANRARAALAPFPVLHALLSAWAPRESQVPIATVAVDDPASHTLVCCSGTWTMLMMMMMMII